MMVPIKRLGKKDKMKQSLVHDTSGARWQGTKIIVVVSAIIAFEPYSMDFAQAYLQSSEKLKKKVDLNISKEMNLKPNHLIQILKLMYSLTEGGD